MTSRVVVKCASLPTMLRASALLTITLIAPPTAFPSSLPAATLMAPVNTCCLPLTSAVWLISASVLDLAALISTLPPLCARTVSLFTMTATVAPTLALAGAADSEPAMIRALLPSFAVTSAPLTISMVTLSPRDAVTWLLATATANEPARLALLLPVDTAPAMASA